MDRIGLVALCALLACLARTGQPFELKTSDGLSLTLADHASAINVFAPEGNRRPQD